MARIENPKKAIMSEILEDVLGQVVQKRWLCPICDRYDSICGTSDKSEVCCILIMSMDFDKTF